MFHTEFQSLAYEKQQALALLVLQANWQKIKLYPLLQYFSNVTYVEGIVFDLKKFPTAYFELLKNYISHHTDKDYVIDILKQIYWLLFDKNIDYGILTKSQVSTLILLAFNEGKPDKILNIEKTSIEDICDFCRNALEEDTFEALSIAIINLYTFKNTAEKTTFLRNLKQLPLLKDIYAWRLPYIAKQMPKLTFDDLESLTSALQNDVLITDFMQSNPTGLTAQQRSKLINSALNCSNLLSPLFFTIFDQGRIFTGL